tara:strand:- start:1395 stop:1730 length:336 start_codon:yes stop_codon:yes gene_type:complete
MKKYKLTTYRTITGSKNILEILKKKTGQWILYKNDEPTYFVDCFDFKEESNLILNNLILSEKNTIDEVLKKIKKKTKIKLSLIKPPIVEIELKSEIKELQLPPLPEEWLQF